MQVSCFNDYIHNSSYFAFSVTKSYLLNYKKSNFKNILTLYLIIIFMFISNLITQTRHNIISFFKSRKNSILSCAFAFSLFSCSRKISLRFLLCFFAIVSVFFAEVYSIGFVHSEDRWLNKDDFVRDFFKDNCGNRYWYTGWWWIWYICLIGEK